VDEKVPRLALIGFSTLLLTNCGGKSKTGSESTNRAVTIGSWDGTFFIFGQGFSIREIAVKSA
jgi:hypothetical protein